MVKPNGPPIHKTHVKVSTIMSRVSRKARIIEDPDQTNSEAEYAPINDIDRALLQRSIDRVLRLISVQRRGGTGSFWTCEFEG